MLAAANHFAHRQTDGIVIDLFWDRGDLEDEFRVEVHDRREGVRLVLYPKTGRDAIQAFRHPYPAAWAAADETCWKVST